MNENRQIRVFISSTFRDMHLEREELTKRIFPQLKKMCAERGVTFVEVDLRWGVTEEQAAEGNVLPICLEEIRRCRPYFIGLLGERYGWVPEQISEELIEREPWLLEMRSLSVTELEILHGVLNNPDMAEHAFFYFRAQSYLLNLPSDANPEDYTSDSPESAEKLRILKKRIRLSGFPVHEEYPDPVAFGQGVLEDFTVLINRLFPELEAPGLLEREKDAHEAFAKMRRRVYIEHFDEFNRPVLLDTLDTHIEGDGPPFVILGESGAGKTALLANWTESYRAKHRDELIIEHYIGSTTDSSDWAAMLRRILGELKQWFELNIEIPDKPDALRLAFANTLHMAASRGKCIILMDGLNQLEDRDGALDLVWLPPVIPNNVRMIFSTLPGRPLDDLMKRGWPTLTVQPLTAEERRRFITNYLAQYAKRLSSARAELIAAAPQCDNPLFLQALLEELRLFGVHERLDERITDYLKASTIPALYELILARSEEDYERDRPGLVRDAMSYLWAARRGLSETELLELLGTEGSPLPRAHFSPFYLSAESSLVNRSGLIGFFHDYLRDAVLHRYLSREEDMSSTHLRLADYFNNHNHLKRKVEEAPWHCMLACEWISLRDLLKDMKFLMQIWETSQFDVIEYWKALESHGYHINDGYNYVLETPRKYDESVLFVLASLFAHFNPANIGEDLWGHLSARYREMGDYVNQAACIGNQVALLKERGDLDGALALAKEQEQLCYKHPDAQILAVSLGNQALILKARGQHASAKSLLHRAAGIFRSTEGADARKGLASCLGNQASILHDEGNLVGALGFLDEAERILRELDAKDSLATCLGIRASILADMGYNEDAATLIFEQIRIIASIGSFRDQAMSWHNFAVLISRHDPDTALEWHKNSEHVWEQLGDHLNVQQSLGCQASLLYQRNPEESLRCSQKQEAICRELGLLDGLARSLSTQAALLADRFGRMDEALHLAIEARRLARQAGIKKLIDLTEHILKLVKQKISS